MKLEHSCIYDAHKYKPYKPYFSEIKFWNFALLNKDKSFLGCFIACIAFQLSKTFFSLLSVRVLNNELVVKELLFESKLL